MKLVYIAGPFRGDDSWEVENNIRVAETTGMAVAQLDAIPVIPHTMYRFWDGTLPDRFWLECGIRILERCDAIMMCKGWQYSSGSKAEMKFAKENSIPVFFDLEVLEEWIDNA